MRTLHRGSIVWLAALFPALAACPRSVGPAVPGTSWTGVVSAPLSNLAVCGVGTGFRMRDTRMSGWGIITRDASPPGLVHIRNANRTNMFVDFYVSTYFLSWGCPTDGRLSTPVQITFRPTYVGQMSPTGCVSMSRVTFELFSVSPGAPPIWIGAMERFVRESVHMRLDDWAAAAVAVSPGTTPAPLPAEVGRGRCPDWSAL